ncbi:LAMI_0G05358g1_1 [Lachancea mirantina]|uniref:Large ribosomal subunit protein mL60 n=1 Tax=Lachancea mirantina TaxID=1230905 RepID=A0A1G4K8U7_9SACH|nr:LAMI_0G05358g1_1 [Lachancea mirantina]
MFGPFKSSNTLLGGLLWKIPWRLSRPQKQRQRHRLQQVDNVLKTVNLGLHIMRNESKGLAFQDAVAAPKLLKPNVKQLRVLGKPSFFPSEKQMSYKDKYTFFNKRSKGYRKGIHKLPKWTKMSQRRNPEFF